MTVTALAVPVALAVSNRRNACEPEPSLTTEAVTLPPELLMALASPCRVLLELSIVTEVTVPEPTWKEKVPCVMVLPWLLKPWEASCCA